MLKGKFLFGLLLAASVLVGTIFAQEAQVEYQKTADLVYGKVADRELLLDDFLLRRAQLLGQELAFGGTLFLYHS